jgi:predicted dehydrogenase
MNVVVIGLGSMGKRRIRLMRKYDTKLHIVGIDISEARRKICEEMYAIETYANLSEAVKTIRFDCAFVCTSPLSHHGIITQCLKLGLNVFTELNLTDDGYEENMQLAKENERILFLSSTFLFREEIERIKMLTRQVNGPFNYVYHVGQYLPDWHPWEHYQDFFVGERRTNGCKELFAIELPWLIDVFGDIVGIQVVKSKMSHLDIDYDDNYLIILQHETGCKGTLAVDVVSRKAVRNLEVFGEALHLQWNGTPTGLNVYDVERHIEVNQQIYDEIDQLDDYCSTVVENAYLNEITSFFETVKYGKAPLYSFEKDKYILDIIDKIEA